MVDFEKACEKGDLEMVEWCTEIIKCQLGRGFEIACRYGQEDIARFLLKRFNITVRSFIDNGCYVAASKGRLNIVKLCIEYSDTLNIGSILSAVSSKGHEELTDFILNQSVDIEYLNIALGTACYYGDMELILKLIKHGANDFNGALGTACAGKQKDVIDFLIKYGANDFKSAFEHACQTDSLEIVKYILSYGVEDIHKGFNWVCLHGYTDIIEYLISYGVEDLSEGLLTACNYGKEEIVKFLIKNGANNYIECLELLMDRNRPHTITILMCEHIDEYMFPYIFWRAYTAKNIKIMTYILDRITRPEKIYLHDDAVENAFIRRKVFEKAFERSMNRKKILRELVFGEDISKCVVSYL